MRVKSKWHNKKPKSMEELGSAIAFITWRVAMNSLQRLLATDFDLTSDQRRFAIIDEFIVFLLQTVDRMAHEEMDDKKRARLVTAMAKRLAETIADNKTDRLGEGDYRQEFIGFANLRMDEYAELSFVEGEPGYQSLRYLANKIRNLADDEDSRWIIEQVIDIEFPEAIKYLKKSWAELFSVDTV